MFRKLGKAMRWHKRFRKSMKKYPVFRKTFWPRFWQILDHDGAKKVVWQGVAAIAGAIIFVLCWLDQVLKHYPFAPWFSAIFALIAIAIAISCAMRLYAPMVEAGQYAAYKTREARGDYVDDVPEDEEDDDEERTARHDERYAARRRRSSVD